MSRNSSGTYTAPSNTWNPAVEGTAIDEGDWNTTLADIVSALTDSLDRTGKGKVTAHIDFDENASAGTPDANVGRLYGADDSGLTTIYWKDSSGNVYNLLQGAASGLTYQFNSTTTTNADPGTGKAAFNNATIASATEMAISTTTAAGASVSTYIGTWDDNGTSDRGRVFVQKRTNPGIIHIFAISGANTDASGYKRIALTYVDGTGTLSNNDPVTISFGSPGPAGATGSPGTAGAAGSNGTDPGIRWSFESSTTMAAPASGGIRFNNASLGSVTSVAINYRCGETSNPSVANWVKSFDDSSTSAHRGTLIVKKVSAPENYVVFDITGALTDNTTWAQLAVTVLDNNGSLSAADVLSVQFGRTGDAGAGSFTSLTPGNGVTSTLTAAAPGSAISTSGTISAAEAVNAQTGTTYTVVDGDRAKLLTISNASSVAVTLPQASTSTAFVTGWFVDVVNKGAGTATITPTTSTINGAATLALLTGQGCRIVSDGTNYQIDGPASAAVTLTGAQTLTNKTLTTPVLGVATATSINKVALTAPATGSTLTIADGKTLTSSNTLTLAGTDSTTMTFPATSSTVLTTGNTATITKGYTVTPNLIGTVTSGTTTLDATTGNYQMVVNGGNFSLSPPAAGTYDAIDLLVINGPSAGSVTFTTGKWRVGSSTGSAFSSTSRSSATVTMTIASPCVVSWTSHGCVDGDPFFLTTSGALPTGLSINTVYYVKYIDANSFNLAATPGGSSINTTGSQSGTHTGTACSQFVLSVREIYGSATYSWYALQ